MCRRGALAVLLVTIAMSLLVAARSAGGQSPRSRAHHLAAEFRCPVCQGLSVADSPSSTARAMADDVARRVAAGESDAQIRRDYVHRYGTWILLAPPARGLSALVWTLPVIVVLVGAGGLALTFRRWSGTPPGVPTAADRAMVDLARIPPAREPSP